MFPATTLKDFFVCHGGRFIGRPATQQLDANQTTLHVFTKKRVNQPGDGGETR